jgi:3-oxoacyl-[acyl-carrier-protein] synthase II
MFIRAASSITFQPTFNNVGFSKNLVALNNESKILHPDYSEYIPAMERRRMSDVLKMSIACSKDCLQQINITQPQAIIVGTSMGCCIHTKTFLDKILTSEGGLIAPSAFILSTHNSIAGQISLQLKNHSYNITHTQNSLSFEHALIDATIHNHEGLDNILVGAADEIELELHSFAARLNAPIIKPTCGASFFIIEKIKNENCIELLDVESIG